MSRAEAAAAMDRLPWLPDEPQPKRVKRRGGAALGWAGAAIVAVAGAAFWAGTWSVQDELPAPSRHAPPTTTVSLPQPRPAEPQVRIAAPPQVNPAPQPQVRPAPVREVRIAPPPETHAVAEEAETQVPQAKAPAQKATSAAPQAIPAPAITATNSQFIMPKPWNPRVFAGAAGRVVQIGAFGSTPQAKLGWRFMVRAYPAMAHLPAVVRPSSNSKGRTFYRFQVGTTSQAHSEVLCQRMQRIHFSCAIVGLPWKAKVER
jgi:outer membrane biosynthesis protein TonB